MEEQIISFETAKLAKEKGFDWKSGARYGTKSSILYKDAIINDLDVDGDHTFTAAPTQSLLQKWLREEHNLWVEITIWGDGIGTQCLIKKADPKDIENDNSRIVHMVKPVEVGIYVRLEFNYEKTLEKGLQEALKLIKN